MDEQVDITRRSLHAAQRRVVQLEDWLRERSDQLHACRELARDLTAELERRTALHRELVQRNAELREHVRLLVQRNGGGES